MTGQTPATGRPLFRWAETVQRLMVHGLWFLATSLVFWVALVLFGGSPRGWWLVGLAALVLGPSLVALLSACRHLSPDEERSPTSHYRQGWRDGWRQGLLLCAPVTVALALLAWDAAAWSATGRLTLRWTVVFAAVALALLAWLANVLVLLAHFTFRTRDVGRLAAYYLLARPLVTLGWLALVVGLGLLVARTNELAPALLAAPLACLVLWLGRPVTDDVAARFLRPESLPHHTATHPVEETR